MAQMATLWDDVEVLASSYTITANQVVELLNSGAIDNSQYNSVRVEVEYKNCDPSGLGSFYISTVTEYQNDAGLWVPLPCYQFSPFRSAGIAPKRTLIMQPNMDTFSLGVDDVYFPLTKEEGRTSRSQGTLPSGLVPTAKWRARVLLVETDPGGGNAFVSMDVDGSYEMYDV